LLRDEAVVRPFRYAIIAEVVATHLAFLWCGSIADVISPALRWFTAAVG
jgi:hypothetical protein